MVLQKIKKLEKKNINTTTKKTEHMPAAHSRGVLGMTFTEGFIQDTEEKGPQKQFFPGRDMLLTIIVIPWVPWFSCRSVFLISVATIAIFWFSLSFLSGKANKKLGTYRPTLG